MLRSRAVRAQGPAACLEMGARGSCRGKRIELRAMGAKIQECLEKCLRSPGCRVPTCGGSERGRAEKMRRSMRYVWPTSPQELRIGGRASWKLPRLGDFF